ncbi:cytochrome P450 [Cryphonectria parasitica EP155]|uniref:Cytochrome P450 n=1 Tax=Cryphonectria parasitica (strain ATCC 38755 / EP155) TaxID=660469 RepID=A0A9P4XYJ3_CRYP1|nr:cytochrome P450 [Cryphonectria parasitica EP155]KAF3763271.1 cytochrome P450 [Cryphonectria parasitica EP155]
MISPCQLLCLALLFIGILIARRFLTSHVQDKKKAQLWAKLDMVGVSSGGIFPWTRALLRSLTSTQHNVHTGYEKFSRTQKLPFALPTVWTGDAVVVLPPSMLDLLHKPDSELRSFEAQIETLGLPYMISDRDVYMNVIHFDVVRKHMGENKDLDSLAAATAEELDIAFRECWGTSKDWTTLNMWDTCGRILTRAAARILIGLPMCRDETFFERSRQFADSVVMGSAMINCFPPRMRGLIGPLVALRAKYYHARCLEILVPIVEERLRVWRTSQAVDSFPNDFLQWIIPLCAKQGPDELNPVRIATRLLTANIMFVVGMVYVFAHCVLDIYDSPSKEDFISGLEAECRLIHARYNGLSTRQAVDRLYRHDSAIRESMRLSDFNVAGLARDVVSNELDLGNGIRIPRGVRMVFPTQSIHQDTNFYDDPLIFDAFRFSRKFEGLAGTAAHASQRESLTFITPSFLVFGYGKHTCPGRWFAAQTMKQALAHIIMHYDVEIVKKPGKRRSLLSIMLPPTSAQIRIRRRT